MNGVWLELVGFAANIAEPAGAEGHEMLSSWRRTPTDSTVLSGSFVSPELMEASGRRLKLPGPSNVDRSEEQSTAGVLGRSHSSVRSNEKRRFLCGV